MRDHLLDAVRTFTRTILSPYDRDDLLDQLIGHATATLEAQGAGILLADVEGYLDHAASSGDAVGELEQVQERARAGACYEAFVTNEIVVVADLHADERWPKYAARAVALGFGSVIGVPLNAWGQTIGVLNIYRAQPARWTDDDVDACQILAAMGAGYILNASQLRAQQELAENLQAALASRGVIERAKGMLIERDGIDARAAFESLRESSMNANRKLYDVAKEIVDAAEGR